jgi:hypothetical protein
VCVCVCVAAAACRLAAALPAWQPYDVTAAAAGARTDSRHATRTPLRRGGSAAQAVLGAARPPRRQRVDLFTGICLLDTGWHI